MGVCSTLLTWFINKNEEKSSLWESLLSVALPNSNVTTSSTIDDIDLKRLHNYDFVICLFSEIDQSLKGVLEEVSRRSVPLLCIIDQVGHFDYDFLIQKNVKGIISIHASLDAFQTAFEIVKNGGSYIESPYYTTAQ